MTRKRKRRKPEQIARILKESQAIISLGKSVSNYLQNLEIADSTCQRWNSQFGGMNSNEAKRPRKLVIVNQRLKTLLACRDGVISESQ